MYVIFAFTEDLAALSNWFNPSWPRRLATPCFVEVESTTASRPMSFKSGSGECRSESYFSAMVSRYFGSSSPRARRSCCKV